MRLCELFMGAFFWLAGVEAVKAAVQQLGGAKVVGAMLWPDKTPDAARTRLLDTLNPSRTERLDLSESLFILRKAAEAGLHAPFQWLAAEVGYEARPLQRDEAIDRVAAVMEQAANTLAAATQTMQRLQAGGGR
jgi:hypothetical protein